MYHWTLLAKEDAMTRTVKGISQNISTVIENSGGLSIIEIVERGPQGIAGEQILAAVSFWQANQDYTINQKVTYGESIYNAIQDVPAGTLPTDEAYWEDITGSGESVIPVRGGDIPVNYDPTTQYNPDDRITYLLKEYICTTATTGAFDPDAWNEVSTQSNESRITNLENQINVGYTVNEYEFTQNTTDSWVVINAGATQAEFDNAKIEFIYNGVKMRKGDDVIWVSDTEVRTPNRTSVQNEDYLDIRVTTTSRVDLDPSEEEFTQDVPVNGIWAVTGIGMTVDEFNAAEIQIYYNGVKLRKGSQAIWVSPSELRISYTSVETEDYLTIRNGS